MARTVRKRLILLVAALSAAAVGIVVAFFVPQQAAAVEAGSWYRIISRHSGLALDIEGSSSDNGALLVQHNDNGSTSQQFRFLDSGGGYYRLQARLEFI